jgi:glutaredoxin
MRFLRWLIGSFLLTLNRIFSPRPITRSPEAQASVNESLTGLAIYEFAACPFCIKVRRFLTASALQIPLRDAKREPFRSELLAGGGKLQVPCLQITAADGAVRWLYESSDIISFLRAKI